MLDVPYFQKFPKEILLQASRNANIKDDLFFDIIKMHGEFKNICIEFDSEQRPQIKGIHIPLPKFISQPDVWRYSTKDRTDDSELGIFQTVNVTTEDQYALL